MNNKRKDGNVVTFTAGANLSAGDPAVIGQIPGVVCADVASGASGELDTRGEFTLSVGGVDGVGNSAVAVGDKLYYTSGDTPKINKKTSGVVFGYALGTVTSGGSGSITVLLAR